MIFGPSDAEFHLELEDTKKCIHQKLPKQRDSNGRSVFLNYNKSSITIKADIANSFLKAFLESYS